MNLTLIRAHPESYIMMPVHPESYIIMPVHTKSYIMIQVHPESYIMMPVHPESTIMTCVTSLCPHLLSHHRQHLQLNAVELIKTRPGTSRGQPFEKL